MQGTRFCSYTGCHILRCPRATTLTRCRLDCHLDRAGVSWNLVRARPTNHGTVSPAVHLGGVVLRNGFIFSVFYGYSSNSRSTGYMHAYTHTGNTKNDKTHAGVSTDRNRRRQNIKSMTHRSICPKILPHSTHLDPSYTKLEHYLVIQCPPFRTCMTRAHHYSLRPTRYMLQRHRKSKKQNLTLQDVTPYARSDVDI